MQSPSGSFRWSQSLTSDRPKAASSDATREAQRRRHRLKWVVVLCTFAAVPASIAVKVLWVDWPTLHAWGSALGVLGFASGIVALTYAVLSWTEAAAAHGTAVQLVEDLVRMGLQVDKSHSYKEAFDHHITSLLNAATRGEMYGSLRQIRFLISTPVYGYHVLGPSYLTAFRDALEHARDADRLEVIMFSPDRHYDHVLNTLLWQDVPMNSVDRDSRGRLPDRRAKATDLALEICNVLHELRMQVDRRKAHVWASHAGNVRLAHYDFDRDPQGFLILSDRVSPSTDLLQFEIRVLPLHRNLMEETVTAETSFFAQYKTCPYSHAHGEAAEIDDQRLFAALAGDYVWLRTKWPLYARPGFKHEVVTFLAAQSITFPSPEAAGVLTQIVLNVGEYLAALLEPGLGVAADPLQSQVLADLKPALQILKTDGADVLLTQCDTSLPPSSVARADPEPSNTSELLLSLLFDLVSSGFERSHVAALREERATLAAVGAIHATDHTPE